jgi:hypothetical protein
MSFVIAISGMATNMPGIPHNAPNLITAIMDANALIFTFEATILGTV